MSGSSKELAKPTHFSIRSPRAGCGPERQVGPDQSCPPLMPGLPQFHGRQKKSLPFRRQMAIRDTVDGLLVPSGDISALASAVEQCLEAPEPLRMRALSARSRVEEELSFEARQARLEEVYKAWSRAARCARSNR